MHISNDTFSTISEAISQSTSICVITHIHPDGDAIGSSLAWAGILKQLGKHVTVIIPNDCPEYLRWLDGYSSIIVYDKNKEFALQQITSAELFFCLDFNNLTRLEELGSSIQASSKPCILIDHHPYPEQFFICSVSQVEASSTCELVYHTIIGCGYQQYISKSIAEALYTGIITDTGGLSHNSARPELYHVVADLLTIGVDKNFIHDTLFNVFSYNRMKLLGALLKDNFVYFPEYKTAYMFVTVENQKQYNFQLGDSEGFVNYPLAIKDVVFCALFTEYENKTTKVSFRSKRKFPANAFSAEFFNGGGHLNAAGGRRNCTLEQAISIFEKGLESYKDLLLQS